MPATKKTKTTKKQTVIPLYQKDLIQTLPFECRSFRQRVRNSLPSYLQQNSSYISYKQFKWTLEASLFEFESKS